MGKSDETRVWLSTVRAAEELGVTLRTVYRFLDEGLLPGYRFGRVRVKSGDVDAFIAAQRVEPGTLGHLYSPAVARQAKKEPTPEPVVQTQRRWTSADHPAPSMTTQ